MNIHRSHWSAWSGMEQLVWKAREGTSERESKLSCRGAQRLGITPREMITSLSLKLMSVFTACISLASFIGYVDCFGNTRLLIHAVHLRGLPHWASSSNLSVLPKERQVPLVVAPGT